MKISSLFISLFFAANVCSVAAQDYSIDAPLSDLPQPVKEVLQTYITILLESKNLDECAHKFSEVAGGGLVNEDATHITLRASVKPFSLKKDFTNIKYYANPIEITRVVKSYSKGSGFGASAVKGATYKIWIAKKAKQGGLPAPVTILVPEEHSIIKTPKIVNIGSL